MEDKDINRILEALTLLKKLYWLFEAPEWNKEQEEDAEIFLSIIDTIMGYLAAIKEEMTGYFYDRDAAVVHLRNPAPWIDEIQEELGKAVKIGEEKKEEVIT